MPYFIDKNCFFIHIPKTAGTSINCMFNLKKYNIKKCFYENDGVIEWDHATASMLKNKDEKCYFHAYKFAVVRNPYDRLVSEYWFKKESNDIRIIDCSLVTFDEYVKFLYDNFDKIMNEKHCIKSHFIPQSDFLLPDINIFKFEKIDMCFNMIRRKFKIRKIVEHKNKSSHDPYQTYYDNTLRKKVTEIYLQDFKNLGYGIEE